MRRVLTTGELRRTKATGEEFAVAAVLPSDVDGGIIVHGTPPRSLEIDVGERLTAGVADDEAGLRLDRPRRREGDRLNFFMVSASNVVARQNSPGPRVKGQRQLSLGFPNGLVRNDADEVEHVLGLGEHLGFLASMYREIAFRESIGLAVEGPPLQLGMSF